MHHFKADYIFPISSPPIKNGVVIADEEGEIIDVLPPEKYSKQNYGVEIILEEYSGIICPGFINAHCHLELSHLKGKVAEGKTLPGFIGEVVKHREAEKEIIAFAITKAEDEMIANGIVAVGDICNTTNTVFQKKKNRLRYHNFIELFDIIPANSEKEFEKGIALMKAFEETGSTSSLSPHAPYTVSPHLLKRIYEHAYAHDSILTLHNQETESENEMFRRRSGKLFEKLLTFGNLYDEWKPTGFSSLASTLVHLPKCNKTLLVHNSYSTAEDITWAHLYSSVIWWCFCPNANLYIENTLPDFQIFIDGSCRILLGTDSYASNRSLSILDEMKTISKHFPKIKLQQLLEWATMNGANFFGWKNELGSLEAGKRPGINLITDVNSETLSLVRASEVKPLVKFRV